MSHAFKILLLIMVTPVLAKKVKLGPHWDHRERTTCEEFGRYARFNPYTMPNETWFLFFYWAPAPESFYFYFEVPGKKLCKTVTAMMVKLGPHWDHRERTTCEEFGRYARFNPYTMPNETWFLFFYWAPAPESFYFYFEVPGKKNYTHLHKWLDGQVSVPVNWTAKHVMLKVGRELSLLVELGDRGQYLMYNVNMARTMPAGRLMTPMEVRLKQTGDNKIVGLMVCEKETVFALVRRKELPRRDKLQEEAGRLGYRSRGGKSYLYQGHHWMPIPEQDEMAYWSPPADHFTHDSVW